MEYSLRGYKKGESPKRQLRALCESSAKSREAPKKLIHFIMASGCLQGWRPIYFAVNCGSMPVVWAGFLYLSSVLERARLLL